jgi:hypothetical protein
MRASMKTCLTLFMLLAASVLARGAPPSLLEEAVESWLGERDHWAFTQRAVEYDDGRPHERLERYDPSLPGNARWKLLAIDGHAPSPEERSAWERRKFKKHHRRFDSPIGDYFDFAHARTIRETPTAVEYDVPLRNDKNWLFPTDRVDVAVTVNKQTRALEHLTARVREPFKVLLGIARVTGGALDLDFLSLDDGGDPQSARPSGSARVSVSKFGERVDFTWTDFKRVTPYSERTAARTTDASEH